MILLFRLFIYDESRGRKCRDICPRALPRLALQITLCFHGSTVPAVLAFVRVHLESVCRKRGAYLIRALTDYSRHDENRAVLHERSDIGGKSDYHVGDDVRAHDVVFLLRHRREKDR